MHEVHEDGAEVTAGGAGVEVTVDAESSAEFAGTSRQDAGRSSHQQTAPSSYVGHRVLLQ